MKKPAFKTPAEQERVRRFRLRNGEMWFRGARVRIPQRRGR